MGSSYGNFNVRADQKKVAGCLKYARRPAFVSPAENGCCVVCEPLDADFAERGADLSQNLRCVVLAVMNDDDDRFMYQLWKAGELLDSHRSPGHHSAASSGPELVKPDEWTPENDLPGALTLERWDDAEDSTDETIGDAELLCSAFDRPHSVKQVARIPETSPLDVGGGSEPPFTTTATIRKPPRTPTAGRRCWGRCRGGRCGQNAGFREPPGHPLPSRGSAG